MADSWASDFPIAPFRKNKLLRSWRLGPLLQGVLCGTWMERDKLSGMDWSIWTFEHDPYGPSWGVREWGMLSQKVSLCHLWRLAQCAIGHHWGRIFSISNYGNYEKRAQVTVSNCGSDVRSSMQPAQKLWGPSEKPIQSLFSDRIHFWLISFFCFVPLQIRPPPGSIHLQEYQSD